MHRTATAAIGWLVATAVCAHAGEERLTCPMGREFFLYAPDGDAPQTTRWLVVGVHGYRGDGRGSAGLAPWAARSDVIVVGPSFPDGYQGLGFESDGQLIGIFSALKQRFQLHPKLFVHGFSGGAQFAHRFALSHPDLVAGCSAHSGGTWDDGLNPAAVGVPFAVSCGANDTGKSMPSSPLTRVEWFKAFVGRLNDGSFSFKARTWPGVEEDSSGWRMNPAGRDALAAAREAFLNRTAAELTARIDAAGVRPRSRSGLR